MDQSAFKLYVVLEPTGWSSLHQCLLMLFDSPLNHAGHLQVYLRLEDGRTIRMHREVRIPRTFKRFEQLFVNFLEGVDLPVVQTKEGPARLLQFTTKPLDQILPTDCRRFRISNLAPKLRPADYFTKGDCHHVAIFIDVIPVDFNILGEGRDIEYEVKTIPNQQSKEDTYSISRYPISPSLTCVKIATAFERALEIF